MWRKIENEDEDEDGDEDERKRKAVLGFSLSYREGEREHLAPPRPPSTAICPKSS